MRECQVTIKNYFYGDLLETYLFIKEFHHPS